MTQLSFALLYRTSMRAQGVHIGDHYRLGGDVQERYRVRIEQAGELVLSELNRAFQDPKSRTLDLRAVASAFESFARGEYWAGSAGYGEPNGPTMFCFPELALAMVNIQGRPSIWDDLFRVFCVASEIFAVAYHQGTKATYCAMRRPTAGPNAVSESRMQAIRSKWAGPVTETQFDQLLYSVSADEYDADTRAQGVSATDIFV